MAEIVNLNRYRKKQDSDTQRKQAAENRVKFGRSKSGREESQRQSDKSKKALDDKKLD
jgi:hypothetical protein